MKLTSLAPLFLAGLASAAGTGCTRKPSQPGKVEPRAEASDPMSEERRTEVESERYGASGERADEQAERTQEMYAKSLSDKLNTFDDRIRTLEGQVAGKADADKEAIAPRMDEVKAKRQVAAAHLKTLKDASANAWKDVRQGADDAFEELEASVQKAESWVQAH